MGFGSDYNYLLYSNCQPVTNLSVVIDVTQDIFSSNGFSFQLNAYSPPDANCVWQQYGMYVDMTQNPPQLGCSVDNWPSDSYRTTANIPPGGDLINYGFNLLPLPGGILPAGWKLTISPQNDQNGNINGAIYVVVDNQGNTLANPTISLSSLTIDGVSPPQPVTSADIAPIIAFQLNIVGPDNGLNSYFSSGAGTITYTASTPLTAVTQQPACTAAQGTITEETANSGYGILPSIASCSLTQSFGWVFLPGLAPAGAPVAASQQFGALNQIVVFLVDNNGQLNLFLADALGSWIGPVLLGPPALSSWVSGINLAASQQFGANQTDVFLVDNNGQLNVFWVVGQGHWNGPQQLGTAGLAPTGAPVAASQQFGADQTDVFLVDKNGQLNVFWTDGQGPWSGPQQLGAAGLAPKGAPVAASQQFSVNQTDVFLVDNNGQLNVFWVVGQGPWNGPKTLGTAGLAPAGAPVAASQQFGVNQTDVFLVDNNGQLNVFWVAGKGKWKGPKKLGAAGLAPPGAFVAAAQQSDANQTDVFLVDNNGQLNVFSVVGNGKWSGPQQLGPAGLAPPGAFVAASQQVQELGANQTDVFLVDNNGQLNVFWVDGQGNWNGPEKLASIFTTEFLPL